MFAVFTPSRWRRGSLDSQTSSDGEEETRTRNEEIVRREEERRKKEEEKKIWKRMEQRIFMMK